MCVEDVHVVYKFYTLLDRVKDLLRYGLEYNQLYVLPDAERCGELLKESDECMRKL